MANRFAAEVPGTLAESTQFPIALDSRIEYLTLAVANAKTHSISVGGKHETAITFLTDLEEKLEVAQVQVEAYNLLVPHINDGDVVSTVCASSAWVTDARQIYQQYAEPFDFAPLKLIFREALEAGQDHLTIADQISSRIITFRVGQRFYPSEAAFPLRHIATLLVRFPLANACTLPLGWAPRALVQCRVPYPEVWDVLGEMYASHDPPFNDQKNVQAVSSDIAVLLSDWVADAATAVVVRLPRRRLSRRTHTRLILPMALTADDVGRLVRASVTPVALERRNIQLWAKIQRIISNTCPPNLQTRLELQPSEVLPFWRLLAEPATSTAIRLLGLDSAAWDGIWSWATFFFKYGKQLSIATTDEIFLAWAVIVDVATQDPVLAALFSGTNGRHGIPRRSASVHAATSGVRGIPWTRMARVLHATLAGRPAQRSSGFALAREAWRRHKIFCYNLRMGRLLTADQGADQASRGFVLRMIDLYLARNWQVIRELRDAYLATHSDGQAVLVYHFDTLPYRAEFVDAATCANEGSFTGWEAGKNPADYVELHGGRVALELVMVKVGRGSARWLVLRKSAYIMDEAWWSADGPLCIHV
ncbi:MYND-type domain-containing protein [Mycena chlorophos]|uniref:MYND-type domain-containing protein n=1 Tax=Mycena chlorophos TaxID=658473 RepID=A0A8H6VU15_MYCCL|nr:MYND-type domain-containing protein [Mycena chlorophos]